MAAVGLGRLAGASSRRLGLGGGTTLPGDVARAIDPKVLSKLTASVESGTVLITGTNGKTSTAAMLRAILASTGLRVGGNPSGSNLVFGLTAAAIDQASASGSLPVDWLVLEVDELSSPKAVAEIRPRGLVVLNAFRDQLDRSFEVDQVSARLGEAVRNLPEASFWVGNADDPRVAVIESGTRTMPGCAGILFGLEDSSVAHSSLPVVTDARVCPNCRGELEFSQVYYAHCGVYHCRDCEFARPDPQLRATQIATAGLDSISMVLAEEHHRRTPVSVPLGGIYQAANVAAAFAAAVAMGVDRERAAAALAAFHPAFGRSQLASWEGAEIRLMLAKNPAGLGENVASVLDLDCSPVIAIGLNDGIADGRDVSWIWDVDLERLADSRALTVIASGTRAHDLALRLTYAGLDSSRIRICPEPAQALTALAEMAAPGVPAPAMLTYTAMLGWHRELVQAGSIRPFWES
jgi:UDP-N-acetylmuramyl tripeptide synthase